MGFYNYFTHSLKTKLNSKLLVKAEDLELVICGTKSVAEFYHCLYDFEKREDLTGYNGLLKPTFDTIHLDLDSHDSGETAWFETKQFARILLSSGCPFEFYFSGNKGFHIAIHTSAFGLIGAKSSQDYVGAVKKILANLKSNFSSIDTGVADSTRRFRAWRSINCKSGLYKTRLDAEHLSWDLRDIREIAKEQQDGCYKHPGATKALDFLINKSEINFQRDSQIPIGRNNKLKAMATACLTNRKSVSETAKELYNYDLATHNPRLFLDHSEGMRGDSETHALKNSTLFSINIYGSLLKSNVVSVEPHKNEASQSRARGKFELKKYPNPEGYLKDLVDLIKESSYTDVPNLAIGSAIPIFSTIIGPRYKFFDVVGNIFVILLGDSGAGKKFGINVGRSLLNEFHMLGSADYLSTSGVAELRDYEISLKVSDEFSKLLKLSKGQSGFQSSIPQDLCKLWSASIDDFDLPVRRDLTPDKSNKSCVLKPYVSMLVATTNEEFKKNVSKDTFTSGFIPRYLVFMDKASQDIRNRLNQNNIDLLHNKVSVWRDKFLADIKSSTNPLGKVTQTSVFLEFSAVDFFESRMSKFYKDALVEKSEAIKAVMNRAREYFKKLSLIHSVSRGAHLISLSDLKWAAEVIEVSVYNLRQFTGEATAENKTQQYKERIYSLIADDPMIRLRDLTRQTQFISNSRTRKELILELIDSGRIEILKVDQVERYFIPEDLGTDI